MPLLCSNPSDISMQARDLPVAKSLTRPGSQPLCPHSSSAAHPEAPARSGMCPGTLCPVPSAWNAVSCIHCFTPLLPSSLDVPTSHLLRGALGSLSAFPFFLPSFPPPPFFHTLSLTFFLRFPSLIIPLTTIETYCVFYPFSSFLSLFFHLEYKLHEGREFCLSSPLNPQYLELCLDKKLSRWMDERMNTK